MHFADLIECPQMAEDLVEDMEDAQELQDLCESPFRPHSLAVMKLTIDICLDEDLDEIDATVIFGRRTRGKQIDFKAALERERLERGAGGASGSSADAAPAIMDEESEDDGFDEDYVGKESE